MINSNFYAIDAILTQPTHIQAARAANVVYCALMFRRQIEYQKLNPVSYNYLLTFFLLSRQGYLCNINIKQVLMAG